MARTKVQAELIATNAISGTIIADNAITATHIATNSISGTLVQDSGIVTSMIAANNITSTKIVTDAVLTRHIADDQVTGDKLTNNITIAGTLTSTGAFTSPGIDDNADATAITIDSDENVGIGMTPAALGSDTVLSIYNSATPRIKLHNSTTGSTSSDGGEINMSSSDLIFENREAGNQRFFVNGAERSRIQATGKTAWSANAIGDVTTVPRDFAFYTEGSTNGVEVRSNDERLVFMGAGGSSGTAVDSGYVAIANGGTTKIALNANGTSSLNGGNVGIGTDSPDGILHLKSSADTYQYLEAGSSDGNAGILFQNNSGQTRGYVIYDTDDDLLLFQVNQAERMRILSTGHLLIGRTTTSVGGEGHRFDPNGESFHFADTASAMTTLHVYDSQDNAYRFYVDAAGTNAGRVNATNTTIQGISDIRLKENVRDLEMGMNDLMKLKPRTFDWKEGEGTQKANVSGFIAQEAEAAGFEEFVGDYKHEKLKDAKSFGQGGLVPLLVKCIQELEIRVKELEG